MVVDSASTPIKICRTADIRTLGAFLIATMASACAHVPERPVESSSVALSSPVSVDPESIVFETDFAEDTGYYATQLNNWSKRFDGPVPPPTGWDGVKVSGDGEIVVETGQGIGGSNALALRWDPVLAQPTLSLGKHLTGNLTTGYDELYVRYNVRLPEYFQAGTDGSSLSHWKWGRLWQNTDPLGLEPGPWNENRENSGYVIWIAGTAIPYTMFRSTWSANEGENLRFGSSGGPSYQVDWFTSGGVPSTKPGYWEHIGEGAWEMAHDGPERGSLVNDTNQTWHTIEMRFKLASAPEANDGVFEQWYDGVSQGPAKRTFAKRGAPEADGIVTINRGSGFNFFTFFDNVAGWNRGWGDPLQQRQIYVNDVVVSTERIGHDYLPGGATR